MKDDFNLVWIDLETTGLDPRRHHIVEIATVITDKDLNILAEGPDLVIHPGGKELANISEWSEKNFSKSGLLKEIKESSITTKEAETKTLEFIREYVDKKKSPLCGSSIHVDRFFLFHHMPEIEDYVHYRNIDVSSLKELARRWQPELLEKSPKKEKAHRALSDIKESIEELKYYREHFLKG